MNAISTLLILFAVQAPPEPKPADIDYEARLNDILAKGITPETNAVVLLWKALGPRPEGGTGMPAEYFKRLGIPEPPKEGDYFIGIEEFAKEHLKLPQIDLAAIWDEQARVGKQPWAANDHPHMAAWLRVNEKPLAVVVAAVKRPNYFNPLVARRYKNGERGMLQGSYLSNVQKGRELARALAARAMLRVEEGQSEQAWQDLLAVQRLGRLTARGATLIESLVGIAIGAIANKATVAYLDRVKHTPKQLADRMKDLQSLPPRRTMADAIDLGERNMGLDSLQTILHGGAWDFIDGQIKKPTAEELKAFAMVDREMALKVVNSGYDAMASAMRVPKRAAREKALDQLEKVLDTRAKEAQKDLQAFMNEPAGKAAGTIVAKSIANTLMGLLAPSARKMQSACDRAEQIDRNLQVAFALAAYRADRGRYPAKLDDLAPKYLASVPNDIFANKPLIYRPNNRGYLLYSIGENKQDEEGRSFDDDPRGDDLIVRMPLKSNKK